MKVIQVITLGNELYGAQRHVIDLCLSLKSEGHEVILVIGNTGKMHEYALKLGIETHVLKHLKRSIHPFHDFMGIIELIQLFKKLNPDVVASHSSKAGILARIAAWYLKIPNTFTAHGWSYAEGIPFLNRKIYQIIEKLIGCISWKIITVSEADKHFALKQGVVKASKMTVVHYGIIPPVTVQKSIKYAPNLPLNLVMAARFHAQKDHETLIKALIPLKDYHWRLFLLGDGELILPIKEKSPTIWFVG